MAEEEVVAPAAGAAPSDLKRKLDDLEPESLEHAEGQPSPKSNAEADAAENGDDDVAEAKRLRLDDENQKPDGSANGNGLKEQKSDEVVHAEQDAIKEEQETVEVKTEQHSSMDEHISVDNQQISVKEETKEVLINTEEASIAVTEETKEITMKEGEAVEPSNEEHPREEVDNSKSDQPSSTDASTTSCKIEVPNNKVGVLIGKAGDTIRYLQYNSGAKIQITRDADADPNSATRPVEIIGTLSNIEKAEKLIIAVIAEADAGGSPSLVARGLAAAQAAGIGEQVEIKVPNEKVGLIIGRGGETIKSLQTRSGARIQLIPQHLPEGDGSKERIVRVTGDMRQIEVAQEMIKEVLNQTVRPSPLSSGFNQQGYRPRGPTGPPQWGPRGSHPAQPMVYDYQQRGPYPSQNQYPHPTYGNYPQQMAPRGNYGGPPSMQGPPQSGAGGYDYYGGHGGHVSDRSHSTSIPGHAPVPSQAPAGGPPLSQANYNYGQPHGPEYGHQPPYAQSAPQQSYGHGYEENHAPMQHQYGGHGNSQPIYSQGGMQPSYPPQQQYSKPPYGMPTQGTQPQSYGAARPGQPGEMPYQSQVSSAQSYGPNVPHQQPYPYATSGAMQQTYPSYGSAPTTDGYNQPPPASGPGYSQQGGQAVPSYTQPAGQQASGYGQVAPAGYAQYTNSQQVYPEQQAQNSTSYGYQGTLDPSYGSSTAGSAYAAPASGQTGYAQPTAAAQPSYDQSASQASAYGVAQGSATVGYGKTVSPQPAYPQYDSTQMYAAPR